MAKNYFGIYELSPRTLEKLKDAEEFFERDANPANPGWTIVKPKREIRAEEPATICQDVPEIAEDEGVGSAMPATQFYYSQQEAPKAEKKVEPTDDIGWVDTAESLYESLENTNGTLSLVDLTKLSDTEVEGVVKYLSGKLSLKGVYNLCRSVCSMSADQSIVYIKMICSNLLLQKIIDLQEASRLMSSLIHELVEKFSEDVREFLFIPMLAAELRDTSAILAIISSFPAQRKMDLITSFLVSVNELKKWHVNILSQLMIVKLPDNSTKAKLLNLLLEKASTYSKDKNYGKCILSFLKLNAPFTEDEKISLCEIVAVNETIFKRVMESLLKNMYFHDDLWHIS